MQNTTTKNKSTVTAMTSKLFVDRLLVDRPVSWGSATAGAHGAGGPRVYPSIVHVFRPNGSYGHCLGSFDPAHRISFTPSRAQPWSCTVTTLPIRVAPLRDFASSQPVTACCCGRGSARLCLWAVPAAAFPLNPQSLSP